MKKDLRKYWKRNLTYLVVLLSIWFIVSYVFGILLKEQLGAIGFWFAQQGSIYVFIVLIYVYILLMNRLDKKYDVDEE
jgi:putative solute:sodium symporter small subunit